MKLDPLDPLPLIDVFARAGDTSIRRKGSDPSKLGDRVLWECASPYCCLLKKEAPQ
jgi:hypothetical protein